MHKDNNKYYDLLSTQGYFVAKNILDEDTTKRLSELFDEQYLNDIPQHNFSKSGALCGLDLNDKIIRNLLSWQPTINLIKSMGFSDIKLHSFYLTVKHPGAKALSWHNDTYYKSNSHEPHELFVIYYLDETNKDNGCLRVRPRSFDDSKNTKREPKDIPIKVGDVFIGDRRIEHSTRPNITKQFRRAVTISYALNYFCLPASIKELVVKNRCVKDLALLRKKDIESQLKELQIMLLYTNNGKS